MTRARDAATNSHVTTYVHPTGAGNQHVPAAGAAGQLLQYASAGTAAWATISTGADDVVFPNIASPNSTYTSSGTWSKGSLSDDDYVWIYLVGGGQGGKSSSAYSSGSNGGAALLIYGKAKFFDGGAYVVGTGTAGSSSATAPALGAASTFTLTSTYDSRLFTTADAAVSGSNQPFPSAALFNTFTGGVTKQATTNIVATAPRTHDFILGTAITGWTGITSNTTHWNFGEDGSAGPDSTGQNGIFGGGAGGGIWAGGAFSGGGSLYAGAGGASSGDGSGLNGTDGSVPGGGGGNGGAGAGTGGAGANGNVRVYHV